MRPAHSEDCVEDDGISKRPPGVEVFPRGGQDFWSVMASVLPLPSRIPLRHFRDFLQARNVIVILSRLRVFRISPAFHTSACLRTRSFSSTPSQIELSQRMGKILGRLHWPDPTGRKFEYKAVFFITILPKHLKNRLVNTRPSGTILLSKLLKSSSSSSSIPGGSD